MAKFNVTVIFDASQTHEVEADTAEEAAEMAYDIASASLCHQCSRELEVGDPIRAYVYNEDCTELLHDDGDKP